MTGGEGAAGSEEPAVAPARRRAGFLLVVLAALCMPFLPPVEALDRLAGDAVTRLARAVAPRPAPAADVAIIGVDDATYAAFPEPFALWHAHFGAALTGLAAAGSGMVALDVVLPDRSFDSLKPGGDSALMRGLLAKRRAGGIAVGITTDATGRLRRVHPPFLAAAGPGGQAAALLPVDPDHVIRRFALTVGGEAEGASVLPTLVGALAAAQGLRSAAASGGIDYTVGDGFSYVPLHEVVRRAEAGDTAWLAERFGGRPVLIGTVLPFEDRLPQPVPLAAWEPGQRTVPGVLIHAQALRTLLAGTPVRALPEWVTVGLCLLMTAGWWLGRRPVLTPLALVAVAGLGAAATVALTMGVRLPLAAPALALVVAVAVSVVIEAVGHAAERRHIRDLFSGYVGGDVLSEILAGKAAADFAGERRTLTVLVSDVRGFTTRSENTPATEIVALLNRYFTEMVACVHENRGTVDKFMGDGLLAFFGAPRESANPPADAFAAARAMLDRLDILNAQLVAEGIEPLEIGIGLAHGEAVVGTVGGHERHEYTAIGDTVNLASRVEALTKTVGGPILLTWSVAEQLPQTDDRPRDVGLVDIRGRAAERLAVWPGRTGAEPRREESSREKEQQPCLP